MKTNEGVSGGLRSKSGREMAERNGREWKKGPFPKSHVDHWKQKIFRPTFKWDGRISEVPDYSVRIQFGGRRMQFALNTPNQSAAAEKARDIYLFVQVNGWDAALDKFKPTPEAPAAAVATIGEVIEQAGKLSTVKPRSLALYVTAIRQIAAELEGIEPPTITREVRKRRDGKPGKPGKGAKLKTIIETVDVRYAHRLPAFTAWRAKVDAVPVDKLTGSAVSEWRARRVAAKTDPTERRQAEITADSLIRSAKALFGKKLAPMIGRAVNLPDPLPFEGISLRKSTRRFKAEVSPEWIFARAGAELAKDHPEQFKALTLCLLAGLRRAEADCLTWRQINLEEATITIEATEYFQPKSDESERQIDLSPEAVDLLRTFKRDLDPDAVFVLKGGKAKVGIKYQYYRADCWPHFTWKSLSAWLRGKGISANKPIHSLRKQAGSLIHATYGIEAARGFLGHSDIGTTSASYVDKRPRVAVTLGAAPSEPVGLEVTK